MVADAVKLVRDTVGEADTEKHSFSCTYTDHGQKLRETKANGNTVDHTYDLDGSLKSTTEKEADGTTLVASHAYALVASTAPSTGPGSRSRSSGPRLRTSTRTRTATSAGPAGSGTATWTRRTAAALPA
ncbi:hypothetical protein ACPCAE_09085 [Streptomyces cinereoruber]|uniref:hypothetical protein n=1 Tax=Streptomyces cinereoruber TaxID=67260 RepID=UPI003C2EB8BE